jgi:hypothetical protein
MGKPVYRCIVLECTRSESRGDKITRTNVTDAATAAAINAATGRSVQPGSKAALCEAHRAQHVSAKRVDRESSGEAAVSVLAGRTADRIAEIASGERDGIGAITREEMRAMLKAAHARREADSDAVYDVILDAFIARLGEHFARTGATATADERTVILRGACKAYRDNGRRTMGKQDKMGRLVGTSERVHNVSLDAINAPEYASTWGSVQGLTLADTLEDAASTAPAYRVGGRTIGEAEMEALKAAHPAAWAAAQAG